MTTPWPCYDRAASCRCKVGTPHASACRHRHHHHMSEPVKLASIVVLVRASDCLVI